MDWEEVGMLEMLYKKIDKLKNMEVIEYTLRLTYMGKIARL